MKIKKLFEDFEKLEAVTNKIDIYTNETAWDKAYKAEFEAHKALADEIIILTKCDRTTANKMIATKRAELRALIMKGGF